MKKEKLISVLDIGASKVCCLIGTPAKDKVVEVLGHGICHHHCLRRGVVVDVKGLSEAISRAVYEAEGSSGKKVQSVFFNISGVHIKGEVSHGEILISDRDNEITRHDVERVIANAKSIQMPYEKDIIYTARKDFIVDGERGIISPQGMFGLKLETDLYLVTAKISIIDNLKKAVRQAGIGIEDYIITGIATASSVLSEHEKDIGAILVDIGTDLTEVLIFLKERLSHISILPAGGDNITRAISDKLHIPEDAAERIKIENGTLEEGRLNDRISIMAGPHKRTVSSKELKEVLISEYESIFRAIKKELLNSGCAPDASSGVVICGQPAMMDGCLELAELILNFPVRMGYIVGLGSSPKSLPSHIYATAVGLLKYASETKRFRRSIFSLGPKNFILTLAEQAHNLYYDYF